MITRPFEGGTFALRVLWTLPQAHQTFLFHEVRGLCRHYLRSKPGDASEICSEELVSEWLDREAAPNKPSCEAGKLF